MFLAIGYEWFGMTFRLVTWSLLRSNLFASILRRRGDQPLPVSPGEALNRFRHHEDMGESHRLSHLDPRPGGQMDRGRHRGGDHGAHQPDASPW